MVIIVVIVIIDVILRIESESEYPNIQSLSITAKSPAIAPPKINNEQNISPLYSYTAKSPH